jgi:hypothetical protein
MLEVLRDDVIRKDGQVPLLGAHTR